MASGKKKNTISPKNDDLGVKPDENMCIQLSKNLIRHTSKLDAKGSELVNAKTIRLILETIVKHCPNQSLSIQIYLHILKNNHSSDTVFIDAKDLLRKFEAHSDDMRKCINYFANIEGVQLKN